MIEALALGVLGGICLGILAVSAIAIRRLWAWITRRMPTDVEGMAHASGRALAKTRKSATRIAQAFKDGNRVDS